MTEHLINRPAKLTACARCGQLTFTGISGGITIIADPAPLSIDQEIAARLAGKTIYDVITSSRGPYLEWRSLARVKAGRYYAVAASHACARTAQRDVELATPPPVPLPDDPPF